MTKNDLVYNEVKCNPHPDAPHGFCRNASHSADRYVCECESWTPPDEIQACKEALAQPDQQQSAGEIAELKATIEELRYMQGVNTDFATAELQAHINVLREALGYHTEQTRPIQKTIDTLALCKAALAEIEKCEPVAEVRLSKDGQKPLKPNSVN